MSSSRVLASHCKVIRRIHAVRRRAYHQLVAATALQTAQLFGRASHALALGGLQLGMFIVASGTIYSVRDHVLLAVYSKQFLVASDLVLPQLIGDSLKVTFLLLQCYFVSCQQTFVVFVSELILGLALYTLYLVLVPAYGVIAPIYAYAAVYAALVLLMIALLPVTKGRANFLTS